MPMVSWLDAHLYREERRLRHMGWRPGDGEVTFTCKARGDSAQVFPDDLMERFGTLSPSLDRLTGFHRTVYDWNVRLRAEKTFKAQHDLTDDEFNDPVNQTLFEITYPECREAR